MSARIVSDKAILRRDMIALRDALPRDDRIAAAETVAARGLPVPFAAGMIISGFSPLNTEIDPRPLMRELADAGARLALPIVVGRGKPLIMRAWAFGDPLVAGVWGIRVPRDDAPAVDPDILLVPLLAFDRRGHRLGYGAGYYDMTLAALRAKKEIVAVGVGFGAQEVPEVPTTPRDARLDLMLTETEVIDFRSP
jgi:5-formyltetrahydrofolate cyclo-ligase